jgi:glyoxylase-like metal-dependent hydrolase (beta-lactamase superfamily II)
MEVHRIVNNHQQSNSYFFFISHREIVMVDIGDFDINCFHQWIMSKKINIRAIFLTHEHSDHCCGINMLQHYHDFDLYCSKICSINIANPKQNFSKYIDSIEAFSINRTCKIIGNEIKFELNGFTFNFIETPGHSPGSICIFVNNCVFTGDTIMQTNTPLNLPHSDKIEYKNSLHKLKKLIAQNYMIYPGHGEPFYMEKLYTTV